MLKTRSLLPTLILVLLLMAASQVGAAPEDPTITGPELGIAGEYLTYSVSNPAGQPLDILSSTGIWVRSIVVVQPTTTCSLDDGGTEDIVTCDGDFKVTISSDLGQRLTLQVGSANLSVGIGGEHLLPENSLVHIYNGLVPAAELASALNPNPPPTTNVLRDDYTSYRLTAINFSSDITRTFDITLTVPLDLLMVKAPLNCVQLQPGVYRCFFTVKAHTWFDVGFEVKWLQSGVHTLTAVGFVDGVEVGSDTRFGNVIFVVTSQNFLPLARR